MRVYIKPLADESIVSPVQTEAQLAKVFCFFFSKKKALSFLKKRNKKLLLIGLRISW
jgi:hypothetical protein